MKPSRDEIKRLIRETISPTFVPLGFANPGIPMWRWREAFVDVLHFYMPSNTTDFTIELACHPRKLASPHPLPWDCIFRGRIYYPDKNLCSGTFFKTQSMIETEREMLIKITPFVHENALEWWSKFSTIEKAIELLANSSESEQEKYGFRPIGSLAYNRNLVLLQSLSDVLL